MFQRVLDLAASPDGPFAPLNGIASPQVRCPAPSLETLLEESSWRAVRYPKGHHLGPDAVPYLSVETLPGLSLWQALCRIPYRKTL